MKVSVKGIYSTALIRFLLDNGYELTKLSPKQQERFGITSEEEPDIIIRDTRDKTGVVVIGEGSREIIDKMKKVFWDSLYVGGKRVEGKYVKIIESGFEFENVIEQKIQEIKKEILPNIKADIGLLFKESCNYASIHQILNEIISILSSNTNKWYVYFGMNSKLILDDLRSRVVRTITRHHSYRRAFSDIVDYSEILSETVEESILLDSIKKYTVEKLRDQGFIKRLHRLTFGGPLYREEVILDARLIDGRIYLKTFRPITGEGLYDGLEIPKEPGDFAITEYLEGSWYFTITYYNKNKEEKGRYTNINTPIEITKDIYYNDLALDVMKIKDKVWLVDEEDFEAAYKQGILTKKLYEKTKEIAKLLLEELK